MFSTLSYAIKLEYNVHPEKGIQRRKFTQTEESLNTEAEFLDVIRTKVFRVVLLAIHSHLY